MNISADQDQSSEVKIEPSCEEIYENYITQIKQQIADSRPAWAKRVLESMNSRKKRVKGEQKVDPKKSESIRQLKCHFQLTDKVAKRDKIQLELQICEMVRDDKDISQYKVVDQRHLYLTTIHIIDMREKNILDIHINKLREMLEILKTDIDKFIEENYGEDDEKGDQK